jgi:hypothetical protein
MSLYVLRSRLVWVFGVVWLCLRAVVTGVWVRMSAGVSADTCLTAARVRKEILLVLQEPASSAAASCHLLLGAAGAIKQVLQTLQVTAKACRFQRTTQHPYRQTLLQDVPASPRIKGTPIYKGSLYQKSILSAQTVPTWHNRQFRSVAKTVLVKSSLLVLHGFTQQNGWQI